MHLVCTRHRCAHHLCASERRQLACVP
ncbi:MAG: hypothetical protein ACI4OX_01930 [Akkermansia sp.]